MSFESLMKQEATEAPQRIAEQLVANTARVRSISDKIREFNPYSVMFVGRGSSDHAGTFAKYLIEIELGIATFSAAPSIATIYNCSLDLSKSLVLIISQSGRSPDILQQAESAKKSGALCVALLNDESSPLAEIVDFVIPLSVGEEKSVAATKSYLATLAAMMQLVAYWSQKKELIDSLMQIPEALQSAVESAPSLSINNLNNVRNLVVLGRGLGFAAGKEIALKLKEVCSIHAECFSSAEFLHGPVTLVDDKFIIINLKVEDESYCTHNEQCVEIANRGAVMLDLKQSSSDFHQRLGVFMILQRFYLDIELIAVQQGLDPDLPKGLKKVTETI
ncbi:MAG: SIS domain-containing protein [Kangiellaceae bacterium]|nr:SIS domain-containing protein [Kangiellaceae bacterium]